MNPASGFREAKTPARRRAVPFNRRSRRSFPTHLLRSKFAESNPVNMEAMEAGRMTSISGILPENEKAAERP